MIKTFVPRTETIEAVFWDGTNLDEVKNFLGKNFISFITETNQIEYQSACFSEKADVQCYIFWNEQGIMNHLSVADFNENYMEV